MNLIFKSAEQTVSWPAMTLISNAGEITPETFLDTTCRENRNISSKDERVSSAVPPCQFY